MAERNWNPPGCDGLIEAPRHDAGLYRGAASAKGLRDFSPPARFRIAPPRGLSGRALPVSREAPPGLPMMNVKRKKLYEGKAKILYEGPEPGTLIQYFKDDATAFNGEKKAQLEGKGVINNRISEYIMARLNGIGVTNHFIKRLNLREQLIREVEIIPLEVVCRNVVAGSMSQRLGIDEGTPLPRSIIEFYLKKDELNDPMVTEEHITAFNWATTQELDDILAMTVRVNDYLSGMFGAVGITLVDFKIEFGRVWENDFSRVILADEISPDSCRLWDTITGEKLDKDRFRRDLGNVIESYTEVARRLGIMKDMPTVIQGGLH
jgi:phosphoribosylaminoimidazole-succinocarboxamide synthase